MLPTVTETMFSTSMLDEDDDDDFDFSDHPSGLWDPGFMFWEMRSFDNCTKYGLVNIG